MSSNLSTTSAAPGAVPAGSSRNAWLIGGALALATAAGAAGLALRAPATPVPPAADKPAQAAQAAVAPKPATPKVDKPAPATTTAAAPACVDCGTVQSVRAVTKKGEASGVGAVAGGVIGAVVGNQIGGGDGRKVATVVGAVGGGLAGHEIEKRSKSTTVYEVQVKMDDGSVRTVEQASQPAVGARVQVEGRNLKPLPAGKA